MVSLDPVKLIWYMESMKRLPCLALSNVAALLLFAAIVFTGCKFFGADPAGPSPFEDHFFIVQTNLVPRQFLKTNYIDVPVPVFVLKTNELNEITQLTNTVIVKQVEVVTLTNLHEVYAWTPKTNQMYVQSAGAVANIIAPGSGGLVVGLLTAGLAAWARLRSHKKTEGVLAQNIESVLEFVEAMPNGPEYTSAIKQIIKTDQEDEGVREKVKTVMKESVDTSDAKSSANEMQKSLVATAKPPV